MRHHTLVQGRRRSHQSEAQEDSGCVLTARFTTHPTLTPVKCAHYQNPRNAIVIVLLRNGCIVLLRRKDGKMGKVEYLNLVYLFGAPRVITVELFIRAYLYFIIF